MCHSGKSHGLNKIEVINFFSVISNLVLPQSVFQSNFKFLCKIYIKKQRLDVVEKLGNF